MIKWHYGISHPKCQSKYCDLIMFVRYVLIGIVATCIFYALSNICVIFVNALIATFLGNVGSFIFGYFAQMRLVFRANPNHKSMIPRYITLLFVIFIYGQICALIGESLKMPYFATSAFIAISVPIFSYPMQKFWVFAK